MSFNRSKLYVFLSIACITGYLWLFFNLLVEKKDVDVCLFKHITHLPCPSCGSTRSAFALINGDFANAVLLNPLGIVIVIFLTLVPLWLIFDLITKKKTLFDFYYYSERILRKPFVSVPLILLILLNWVWNIVKGI